MTTPAPADRLLSLSAGQWLLLGAALALVLPLQLAALYNFPPPHQSADKEMATWVLRLFDREVPVAALPLLWPFLAYAQFGSSSD